jgi:predicted site-specific integrase-resolvase
MVSRGSTLLFFIKEVTMVMTLKEAAIYSGMSIGALRYHCKSGHLRYRVRGERTIIIEKEELEKFLKGEAVV